MLNLIHSTDRAVFTKGVRAFLTHTFITKRDNLLWPHFCEVRDSHTKTDFAAALGTVPTMSEVPFDTEAPEAQGFNDYYLSWENRLHKMLFGVKRSAMDFDQVGQLRQLLPSIANRLFNYPDVVWINRLRNASAIESYDSSRNGAAQTFFFDTTHDLGNGTNQSNIVSGTTTTASFTDGSTALSTIALSLLKDFTVATTRMRTFTDDRGLPWYPQEMPSGRWKILCSPLLQPAFDLAFRAEFISQTQNVFRQIPQVISTSYLPADTSAEAAYWYLFYISDQTNRPFVYSRFRRITDAQIEDKMSLPTNGLPQGVSADTIRAGLQDFSSYEIQTTLGRRGMDIDADTMMNERYLFGARAMFEIFPAIWQTAIQVTNSAS